MKRWVLFVLMMPNSLLASEHGGREVIEIPWKFIGTQTVCVLIVAIILKRFAGATVVDYFRDRAAGFDKAAALALGAKETAEKQKRDFEERLKSLEASAAESILNAKKEAESLRQRVETEAKDAASRMKEDAAKTAQAEIEKAKQLLREELLGLALASTHKSLRSSVQEADQKRLQNEFVDKLLAAR